MCVVTFVQVYVPKYLYLMGAMELYSRSWLGNYILPGGHGTRERGNGRNEMAPVIHREMDRINRSIRLQNN